MREILLILRKDARRLWPRILLVLLATALAGALNATLANENPFQVGMGILWALTCVYMVVSVIHEERLPGYDQYWLTRPYSRPRLLLAKILFLIVCTTLPDLAAQATALAVNGISPLRYAGSLVFLGLIFLAGIELTSAALAAVTENLMQFVWAALAVVGAAVLVVILVDPARSRWDSEEWIRESAGLIIAFLAASAVLFVQYSRRETTWARCILGGAIVVLAAGQFLASWHGAFALESQLGRPIDPSAVRISFQPDRPAAAGFGVGGYAPGVRQAGIALPVLLKDIPAGAQAVSERIAVTIDAGGGQSWSSAWTVTGGIAGTNPLDDSRRIRVDGPYWQYLNVDLAFYNAVKNLPARVHTVVAMTLLGEAQSAPLAPLGRTGRLPGDGFCSVRPGPFANLVASCAWPFRTPARAYLLARSLRTGQSSESLMSPFGLISTWDRAVASFSILPEPLELKIETWQAVAHFERELDIPQIRLGDYALRRITDSQ